MLSWIVQKLELLQLLMRKSYFSVILHHCYFWFQPVKKCFLSFFILTPLPSLTDEFSVQNYESKNAAPQKNLLDQVS